MKNYLFLMLFASALVSIVLGQTSKKTPGEKMIYKLPELGYSYDALEPYIDAKTMEIHHSKHHQAYVDNLNKAIGEVTNFENKKIEEVIANLNDIPEAIRTTVRNNGGGHLNHSFFWQLLKKDVKPNGPAVEAIQKKYGDMKKFMEQFKSASLSRFGSGWTWLVLNNGELEIMSTPNQDSPLSEGKQPILGLDVWEHAYYLKYQNRRGDYVDAFFNIINWDKVNENFAAAKK
jgi:Fe-Mn family superoxide dismutase